MPIGKGRTHRSNEPHTKGISMKKAPIDSEDISRYADTVASIRISHNGHGNYVGIGRISLDQNDKKALYVNFEKSVGIQSRQIVDELTSTSHPEPEAIAGTFAVGRVERFDAFEVIGKKDDEELHLRSKANKATVKLYYRPSLAGKIIESIVAKQEPRK